MGKRKVLKSNLLKCKGHNVDPCFNCKRRDNSANQRLVPKLATNRQGFNSCEHFT